MSGRAVDEYGRIKLDRSAITSMRYNDMRLHCDVFVDDGDALIDQYNDLCRKWDRAGFILATPPVLEHTAAEEHARRQATWSFPDVLADLDVRRHVIGLCANDAERARVDEEMDLFETRAMTDVLRLMIFLIDTFRSRKIVWGVGRGSSVASYVLFKIGVHKIDCLKYGLGIREFIRD